MARRKINIFSIIVSLCLVFLLGASLLGAFGKVSGGGKTSSDISNSPSNFFTLDCVGTPYSKQTYSDFQKEVFSQDLDNFYITSNFSGDYNHTHQDEIPYYCDSCYCPYAMCRSMAKIVSIQVQCAYFEFDYVDVPGVVKFFSESSNGEKTEVYSWCHSGESNIIQSPELRVYFGEYFVDVIFNYYYGHFYYGLIFDYVSFGDVIWDETEEGLKNFEDNYILPALNEIISDGIISIDCNVVDKGLGVRYYDHIER